jgi:hypothetical protein
LWQILFQKSFCGGERKFLEPLMSFMRDDVRDHIVHPKSITDLRSGVEKRRSGREVSKSTFARFLGLFNFRLLQQYRHETDMPTALRNVRCQGQSGKHMLASSFSGFDPTETFRNAASAARVCRHLLFDVWSQGVSAAGPFGGDDGRGQ